MCVYYCVPLTEQNVLAVFVYSHSFSVSDSSVFANGRTREKGKMNWIEEISITLMRVPE